MTPSYPPHHGGLENLVAQLALHLQGNDCEVTVVTQFRGAIPESQHHEVDLRGVKIHRFNTPIGGKRFGYSFQLTKWLRLHQIEFDVIHVFNYHAPVALATVLRTRRKTVFSPTFHGDGHSTLARLLHIFYRPAARLIFHRADRILCISEGERRAVVEAFPFCASRTVCIQLAPRDEIIRDNPKNTLAKPVILIAGRLEPYKRIDLVIKSMPMLTMTADLIVCGSGPDRTRLEQLVFRLGLENSVHLMGFVSDDDLSTWLAHAHVVVSMSTKESYGFSVAEGIAAGANVIVSDIHAHQELIEPNDSSAKLVSTRVTPQELATYIDQSLTSPRQNFTSSRRRTWNDVAHEIHDLYRSLSDPK